MTRILPLFNKRALALSMKVWEKALTLPVFPFLIAKVSPTDCSHTEGFKNYKGTNDIRNKTNIRIKRIEKEAGLSPATFVGNSL